MDSSINRPIKIVFVCEGNICRSPMAEFIFKDMTNKAGLSDCFEVTSRGTSYSTIGQDIYPKAKEELAKHGIPYTKREAKLITKKDYDEANYVIGMETMNLIRVRRLIFCKNDDSKLCLLCGFSNSCISIDDPFFTGDFITAFAQIKDDCKFLLNKIKQLYQV